MSERVGGEVVALTELNLIEDFLFGFQILLGCE